MTAALETKYDELEAGAHKEYFNILTKPGNLIAKYEVPEKTTALSTCEAELSAIKKSLKSAIFLEQLLIELGERPSKPIRLASDNQAALKILGSTDVEYFKSVN